MNYYIKNIPIIFCVLLNTCTHTSQPYSTAVLMSQNYAATAKLKTQLTEIATILSQKVPVTTLHPIILEYLAYGVSIAILDTTNIDPARTLNPAEMKFDDKGNLL